MFRGVSDTCQNMFRMIYFEAEDIFWKWFLVAKRDQSVTDPPHPRVGKRDRLTVTNLRQEDGPESIIRAISSFELF